MTKTRTTRVIVQRRLAFCESPASRSAPAEDSEARDGGPGTIGMGKTQEARFVLLGTSTGREKSFAARRRLTLIGECNFRQAVSAYLRSDGWGVSLAEFASL